MVSALGEIPDAAIGNKLGAYGEVEKDFVSCGHT
jgi:hypothetical protein